MIQAAAAVSLRNIGRVEAELADLGLDFAAELKRAVSAALDFRLQRIELALDETAHTIDDQRLFWREIEVHVTVLPSRHSPS